MEYDHARAGLGSGPFGLLTLVKDAAFANGIGHLRQVLDVNGRVCRQQHQIRLFAHGNGTGLLA
ncbi:hypothetical protein [Hymenobacter radiodurans]|uniref:hypothetical protein n=1 Tax=Hymenobacter radiodurans TaxID=2496028 RepID=UPI00140457BE|nr:hypothetical protein [Hymenobacter radiodurans]